MARVDLNALPDNARTWIFGISPRLDDEGASAVMAAVNGFLDSWKSHGETIVGAAQLLEGSFLLLAITPQSETSGCSIDKLFAQLRTLETRLGVAIVDSDRIFFRDGSGDVRAVPRFEFRSVGKPETVVFDTAVERLAEVRTGAWEKPAAASWHARLVQ